MCRVGPEVSRMDKVGPSAYGDVLAQPRTSNEDRTSAEFAHFAKGRGRGNVLAQPSPSNEDRTSAENAGGVAANPPQSNEDRTSADFTANVVPNPTKSVL